MRDIRFSDAVKHLQLNPDAMISCECSTCDESCECNNVPIQYDDKGRMIQSLGANRKYVDAMTECSAFCLCFPDCRNAVATRGRQVPLEVFKTEKRGWGLRCPIDLPAGTFVDCYFGELIVRDDGMVGNYLFDLDFFDDHQPYAPRLTINGEVCGSLTRFMNNSCDPNCRVVPVCPTELSSQMGWYYLAMFTAKDVLAFTELTFRYAGHADKMHKLDPEGLPVESRCNCGAKNCCGYMWLSDQMDVMK